MRPQITHQQVAMNTTTVSFITAIVIIVIIAAAYFVLRGDKTAPTSKPVTFRSGVSAGKPTNSGLVNGVCVTTIDQDTGRLPDCARSQPAAVNETYCKGTIARLLNPVTGQMYWECGDCNRMYDGYNPATNACYINRQCDQTPWFNDIAGYSDPVCVKYSNVPGQPGLCMFPNLGAMQNACIRDHKGCLVGKRDCDPFNKGCRQSTDEPTFIGMTCITKDQVPRNGFGAVTASSQRLINAVMSHPPPSTGNVRYRWSLVAYLQGALAEYEPVRGGEIDATSTRTGSNGLTEATLDIVLDSSTGMNDPVNWKLTLELFIIAVVYTGGDPTLLSMTDPIRFMLSSAN